MTNNSLRDLVPGPSGLMAVVTTIQSPTVCIDGLMTKLRAEQAPLLVIGDRKGPKVFEAEGAYFVSIEDQRSLPFDLVRLLPEGHYGRKNLGYLLAFQAGASHIYETDDDNAPEENWCDRQRSVEAVAVAPSMGWLNAYASFSDELIWPRGFPLELAKSKATHWSPNGMQAERVDAPIQQGLANGAPDVDAVWRLILDREVRFNRGPSLLLPRDTWCPFNSQSTWWWPDAYALMYLPSFCSFRMTDIWRSFVAQRCLWELDGLQKGIVFHEAEVVQLRNAHRLIKDFEDEVVGYLHNDEMMKALQAVPLEQGFDAIGRNMLACYEVLVERKWIGETELPLLRAWLADIRRLNVIRT